VRAAQFRSSFFISVMRTIGGSLLTVLVTVLSAYPLSVRESFPGKQVFKWLLIVSMLFQGGLIPWYLALRSLGLTNNLWGLILPGVVVVWLVIIAFNCFRNLPVELAESAQIDGASHWVILFRIYLPLSLPMLATVTLFIAVGHWNSWFDGLVLMNDVSLYPLMTYMRATVLNPEWARMLALSVNYNVTLLRFLSDRGLRGAMIVVTTLPILVLYPFLQRYFVHGLTLGAVKG
jgi:putative aldouronate transport system permease protein